MTVVSVIIPVYNRQKKVIAAIRSVLSQSFTDFELIVVDDASCPPLQLPDDPGADQRIKLIRKNINGGAGAARNSGAGVAKGDWIAWLDSDDTWKPDKLARQLKVLANTDPETSRTALATGYKIVGATSAKELYPVPSDDVLMFFSSCWFCPGSTVMLSRRMFERVGPYDENMERLEDLDWFARFALDGGRLETIGKVLVEIEQGQKADYKTVCIASHYLRKKYAKRSDELPEKALERLSAYLDIECASSALLKERKIITGLGHLLSSWIKKPRLRLQLEMFAKDSAKNKNS